MARHLRSLVDLTPDETLRVVELAKHVKSNPGDYATKLAGKSIAMIFAKQSTRTRISFEVGIHQLGAQALALSTGGGTGMQMGRGETIHDTAKVDVDGLAEHGSIPIVNALTDLFHPCQALADLLTIEEHLGTTKKKKLVYIGAGNNVAHSLMLAGPRAGMDVTCCSPLTLPPNGYVTKRAMADAAEFGTKVELESDPRKAVEGAHVLYTDTWVSMGEEEEAKRLMRILDGYTITDELMKIADPSAIFMHCLPAHRGEEVTAEVMDGPKSVVFDEAENRLHAQKALLLLLFGAESF
jgi:ornithine carbamoyltransferase